MTGSEMTAARSKSRQLTQGVATALLPLVVFWLIETYWGLEAALIAGCVTAVIEIVYEKLSQKRVSFMTWVSNGMVLGLGAVSYGFQSGVAFKLQPAIMELAMAVTMVVLSHRGKPFLVEMMKNNPLHQPNINPMVNDIILNRMVALDRRMQWFFAIHGLAVGAAAIWGSTSLWMFLKGVLFYVLMVAVMVIKPRQ